MNNHISKTGNISQYKSFIEINIQFNKSFKPLKIINIFGKSFLIIS